MNPQPISKKQTRRLPALILALLASLFVVLPAFAVYQAEYLEPGPAVPPRPPWSQPYRDIPWWFADAAGASDAYDVSVIWATKINSGGTAGDYEAAIISPPAPIGTGGTIGTTQDFRWWPSGTPNTAGTFTTPDWDFLITYDWDPAANAGAGGATATMVLTQGASSHTATSDVTNRVNSFTNGTSPYTETHTQEDILLRLSTNVAGTTFDNMKVEIKDVELSVGGGAFQALAIDNDNDNDQAVNATDDPTVRQVGLIFINDALSGKTTDMQLRGKLNFGYTRSNAGSPPSGPPSGANMMFEVKLGDLDLSYNDYGDLPDTDPGTGAGNYQTLSTDIGATHVIIRDVEGDSIVHLGAGVDDETEAFQNATATGDDTAGTPDDEDGVTFLTPLVAGTNADVRFVIVDGTGGEPAGGPEACVSLFADFNADGDFSGTGEHPVNQQTYSTGTQTASFAVPATATGPIGVRVRLTDTCNQGGQDATGGAASGEVEDYLLGAIGDYVWNDLDNNGIQDEPSEEGQNGVVVNLLDSNGDPVLDGDGNPITTTTADDAFGNPGYYEFAGLPPGDYIIEFVAPTGKDFTIANVNANGNDDEDSDANTTTGRSGTVTIGVGEVNDTIDAGLVDEPAEPLDFGDLPDTYDTLLAGNGPRHTIVSDVHLGDAIDDETDGQPNATATGDDVTDTPDEDGLIFLFPLIPNQLGLVRFDVRDGDGEACVSLFVDYNGDGDFDLPAETAIDQRTQLAGVNTEVFFVQGNATGAMGVRVRLTDECEQGGQSPTGAAPNGEVEDYILGAIGDYVWNDTDGDGIQNEPAANGQNGVVVNLLDSNGDPVTDSGANPITTTTVNDANGNPGYYEFPGLPPGDYIIEFVAPAGKDFTIANVNANGNDDEDSDANTTTGRSGTVTIGAGEVNDTIDAGLLDEPAEPLDFGDLPDTGAGTGAGNYQTLSNDSGPSHVIVTGLFLGNRVDAETDGQPDATATGDDTNGTNDDEDGLAFNTPLVPGKRATIQLTVRDAVGDDSACINMYLDLNGNGILNDTGERVLSNQALSTGAQLLQFNVPAGNPGAMGVRVRMTDDCSQGGELPTGPAQNGEVEDYILGAIGDYVWFDDNGNGIQDEGASFGVNGVTVRLLRPDGGDAGTDPDPVNDGNGNPITTTTADDANGDPGYYAFAGLPPGDYIIEFVAPTGQVFTQTGQGTAATDSDADTTTGRSGTVTISAGEVDDTIDAGLVDEPQQATLDFGDLPDTSAGTGAGNYQTTLANNGPRHTIAGGVRFGAAVDAETDGQPNGTATGDDTAGTPDDEDGITVNFVMSPGNSGFLQINTVDDDSVVCRNVFIDYNGDGDFGDTGEHVVADTTVTAPAPGTNFINITVPSTATGIIGIRARVTDNCGEGGNNPTGAASTGEVEDYLLGAIGDYVWEDLNGDGDQDGNEPGVNGVTVKLYFDLGQQGLFFAGQTTTVTKNGNDGYYEFVGLPPGNYVVEFVRPAGYDFTDANSGNTDADDSDADKTTGRTGTIAISEGEFDDTIDAGLVSLGSDWGDLPDSGAGTGTLNYQTLSNDTGPSHPIFLGLRFGPAVDSETDGQPNATATGDDVAATDDEDGLDGSPPLVAGRDIILNMNGAGSANDSDVCINIFVDFNGDGDFDDAGEHALQESSRGLGYQGLPVSVPATIAQVMGLRVRMTDECGQGGNTPTGAAQNGEVEDYLLGAIGDYVWNDTDQNGLQNEAASSGQNGVTVRLLDGSGNPLLDGNGNPITTVTANDVNGNPGYYEFAGLFPGSYIIEFVEPAGKDFTTANANANGNDDEDSDANTTTGRTGAVTIAAGEVNTTLDAGLIPSQVVEVCIQSEADYLLTDILGIGMGNMKKHQMLRRLVIPNWQNVDSLYGQLAGKEMGQAKYVRFIYPNRSYVQVNSITSPASQKYGVFWYGTELNPAANITGRWFLQMSGAKNHIPRALVLYPTYETQVPYVNVFEPIQAADTQVYWDSSWGWSPTKSYALNIPAPQAPTTLTVKVAQVDNDKDARPVHITVEAGGVSVTQSPVAPNKGEQLDILTFVLENVPAGTDEVTITATSYGPYVEGLGALGGDSTAIIGATANYICE